MTNSRAESADAAQGLSRWQRAFDEVVYAQILDQNNDAETGDFNTTGWVSTYTGELIPESQMREQVEQTVARIMQLNPRHVLEIGCGTGLLLFQIAPEVERYVATDFSTKAIEYVRRRLDGARCPGVSLERRSAEDFTDLSSEGIDMIILNSIVQYFPSADYLLEVIEGAIDVLPGPGHIFVGDVRNLELIEAFCLSVELNRASPELSVAVFRQRVAEGIKRESELALSCDFFTRLRDELPRVTAVRVQQKRGRYHNEFTRYRYDVVIEIDGGEGNVPPVEWLDWAHVGGIASLGPRLTSSSPQAFGLRGVPNARVHSNIVMARALLAASQESTLDAVMRAREGDDEGIDPEDLWQYSDNTQFDVHVIWANYPASGLMDALFVPRTEGRHISFPVTRHESGAPTDQYDGLTTFARIESNDKVAPSETPIDRQRLDQRHAALSPSKKMLLNKRLRAVGPKTGTQQAEIRPRPPGVAPPLSFAQQRLWFLDQLAPGSAFYSIPSIQPFAFPVNVAVLKRCINEIVRRHEALRTTFQLDGDEPIQVIAASLDVALPVEDLSELHGATANEEVVRIATQEATRPFSLSQGPLVRAQLLRLGEANYVFVLTLHHIVADGWSMDVFFRELVTLYKAFAQGQPSPLPPLEIQYADFALWQRSWLRGDVLQKQLDYWKGQLHELPQLHLPLDSARPAMVSFVGAYLVVRVSERRTRLLRDLANAHGATLFMVLLSAFKVLLARYTGQTDIVVGAPIANRNRRQIEPLIGFFVNSLVLRTDLSGDPDFKTVLQRVREVTLGAYAHQDVPFEKLVEELQPERDLSRNPLAQVTFQLQNTPASNNAVEGGQQPEPIKRSTSIFDLAFSLWETTDGLLGGIEYSTEIFEERTIEDIAEHYSKLLDEILAAPDAPISSIALLTDAERHNLIVDANTTEVDFGAEMSLHHLIEAQVARTPQAIAIESGATTLTYCALNEYANELAGALRDQSAKNGEIVGVFAQRSPEMIWALLGVLKAGKAYLPLEPDFPPARIEAILSESGIQRVVTTADLAECLPNHIETLILGATAKPSDSAGDWTDPEDTAYVLFTSGSTGTPKGVLIPHRAAVNHMQWMQAEFPLDENDAVVLRTPFHFDASIWEIFAPLQAGARLILHPHEKYTDAEQLIETIERHGVTVLQVVPSLLRMLLDIPQTGANTTLRRVFCGAERLDTELVAEFHHQVGCDLINLYGPTETTIDATFWRCDPTHARSSQPIGQPIANVQAHVLDSCMEPTPIGVPGEIWIGGKCVGLGYLGRADLSAQAFVRNPFVREPGALLYRTRDLGRRNRDGSLDFLGRVDEQVKLRGYRVELGEIRQALLSHPDVKEAVVIMREGAEGDRKLAAYVVQETAPELADVDELGRVLEEQHITEWRNVYSEIYAGVESSTNAAFDTVGWVSSYTNEPIPHEQMQSWVNGTVARISSLAPRRVLEVGVGTGLLLRQVAPSCDEYVGLDFSEEALQRVAALVAHDDKLSHVQLVQGCAHELEGLVTGEFDVVVINSVVQYFPSIDYLTSVLDMALSKIVPGGAVFVGDVRNLRLLAALHLSIVLHSAPDTTPVADLKAAVDTRLQREKELVIDPTYFADLTTRFSKIESVKIQPKSEPFDNEMTAFRYDVTLRVGSGVTEVAYEWIDWQERGLTLESFRSLLDQEQHNLVITNMPNARVIPHQHRVKLLQGGNQGDTAADLQRQLEATVAPGVDPHALVAIAAKSSFCVDVAWLREDPTSSFDLICRYNVSPESSDLVPEPVSDGRTLVRRRTTILATSPLQSRFNRHLAPRLSTFLSDLLPWYMLPSAFMLVEHLPLKPNGKIDTAALPAIDHAHMRADGDFVPPRDALEAVLAGIWRQLLYVRDVGVHDDFFVELGGHSLLATQSVSKIRELLQVELPLRAMFEHPTVAGLAQWLTEAHGATTDLELIAQTALWVQNKSPAEIEALLAERSLQRSSCETS